MTDEDMLNGFRAIYDFDANDETMLDMISFVRADERAKQATELQSLRAQLAQARKASIEAIISLKAIGEPPKDNPPDAHICAVIARSALARLKAIPFASPYVNDLLTALAAQEKEPPHD